MVDVATALERLESSHDVRVVAARDVGSRAWNLAGPDSDVDVRAVFVQDPVEYATLDGYVASADAETPDPADGGPAIEVEGWNVRRFAELVAESNPAAFEFLHSPLRYREFDPLGRLERDVGDQFAPLALYHHYRSLATRQYRKYLQGRLLDDGDLAYLVCEKRDDEFLALPANGADGGRDTDSGSPGAVVVPRGRYEEGATDRTVKRHLYVVRGILYAEYVRETHRFPPLDFPAFLDRVADAEWADAQLVETAQDLVTRKRRGEGDADVGRLIDPAQVALSDPDPSAHAGRRVDRQRVDAFVRETFRAVQSDA